MRKGGGKQKGSAFERQICKQLSLWISEGEREDVFWRSAMSGGRSTVAMKRGAKLGSQAGDVSSIDGLGNAFIERFMIECKAYKTLQYDSAIKGNGNLIKFWERACADAKAFGKLPILIGKQNMFPIMVCLTKECMNAFRIARPLVRYYRHDLCLITWEDFLKIDPKVLVVKKRRTRLKR